MKLTKEEFSNTGWKCTYEEYSLCYCPDCKKREDCIHRDTFRRVPEIDGGLGLCSNLKDKNEWR